MKYSAGLLLCLLALQSIALEGILAEDIEGSGDDDVVVISVVPEATDPEATDPEATDPEATDPKITDPKPAKPETTDPKPVEPELLVPDAPLDGEKAVVEEPKSIEEILPKAAPEDGVPEETPVAEEPAVDPVVEDEEVVASEPKAADIEVLPVGVQEVPVLDDEVIDIPGEKSEEEDVSSPEERLSVPVDVPAAPNVTRSDAAAVATKETDVDVVYTTPGDPTAQPDEPNAPVLTGVDGSPVFSADCPSAEVVPLYTAVTIRCKVTSPSELTNSYFYWHHYVVIHLKDYEVTEEHEFKVIENNSSKITLLPVDKNEVIHSGSENTTSWAREGRYTGMVFPQANNSAILELKIEHMTNQMYRRHFFAVDNEFGTAEYVIELKRESDPGSSAPRVTSSPFAALLAILVVLVFFH